MTMRLSLSPNIPSSLSILQKIVQHMGTTKTPILAGVLFTTSHFMKSNFESGVFLNYKYLAFLIASEKIPSYETH